MSVESRELEEGEEDLGEITADSPASKEAEMLGEDMGATDPFSGLLFSGGAAVENTSEPLAARGEGRSPEDGVEIDNSYYSMDPSPANGGMDLHFKSNKKFNGPILKEKFSIGSTDSKIREGELYKNRLSQLPGNPGQLFDVELGDNDADAGQPMEAPPKGGSVYEAVEESGRTGTGEKVMGYASADLESRDGYLFREGGQRSFAFQEKQAAAGEPGVWGIATTALETATAAEAFSTFSLNVSDVSYQLAAAALLEEGTWPEPDKVRVEEFVNAFDYGDPSVTLEEKVGCRTEQVSHPFKQQRNLVRVSMRVAAAGRSAGQPLRLTVLLDKSGSMEREDREAAVAKAMDALASHLTADDVISVIGFARTPRLIADRMSGDRAGELADLVAQAPSEGGTNLEQALAIGREVALRQRLEGGVNRIVLMTDGAANLGDARPDALSEMVVRLRNEGVAFDACGVGADGLNDEILEALTREGDGRYYFLNRVADADEGFVRQLAGALRPAAKNVKVQVEFNPERVRGYRLLGFEKHRLEKEDFRNDTVDAAEMAAEEAGVAVYQTEVIPEGTGDVGKVWVRFQDAVTGEMVERSWRIPYKARAPRLFEAPPAMKLAATAVLFGERLKGGAGGDAV
ncbi:MAG: von Willebrand factor type A domain-containing protein, partial [Verrucomicrobiales bacterium]|nr:von Willebrand factor type A domain-containing protein [Verrucomicrobiales bacterium]